MTKVAGLQESAKAILEIYGIPFNDDTKEHLHVMMLALSVYSNRESQYRGVWRKLGWRGNIADVLRKANRVRAMFWDSDENDLSPWEDDNLPDLINYVVFAIRNGMHGNKTGENLG